MPEGLLTYYPEVFDASASREFLMALMTTTSWEQRSMNMFGKKIDTPRLTAWYGDPNKSYAFSGHRFNPLPWTPLLLEIKAVIESLANVTFNSVLLNYYRGSSDSVAWHSDNEEELGECPIIASVSFGHVRQFDIRPKGVTGEKYSIRLEDGSVLLMKGVLQQKWEHRVPKETSFMGPRINLTFRTID
ncbi:MAG: alpha-ketoglutarate-dependent dioxygenase AlkB [Chryseolinea sp.]